MKTLYYLLSLLVLVVIIVTCKNNSTDPTSDDNTPKLLPPAAPTGLVVTPAENTINLSWVDHANNETGFKIYVSTGVIKPITPTLTINSNISGCQLSGLIEDTDYSIWVEAYNAAGSSAAALNSARTLQFGIGSISFDVSSYTGVAGTRAIITLSDSDLTNLTAQNVTLVSTSDAAGITVTLTNVSGYQFAGVVTFSTQASAVDVIQVADSDNLTVTYADAGPVVANRTANAIWSQRPITTPAIDVTSTAPETFTLSWPQSSDAVGYYVWINDNNSTAPVIGVDAPATNIADAAVSSLNYTSALGATVTAWIAAYNIDGLIGTLTSDTQAPLVFPSNFNIVEFWFELNGYAHVAWQNKGDASAGYKVYFNTTDVKPAVASQTVGAAAPYVIYQTSISNRFVWVDAINADGITSAHLAEPANAAGASSIIVTPASNSIQLSWSAPALAPTNYEIYLQSNTTLAGVPALTVTGTTANLTGLVGETAYYIWVVAAYGAGGNVVRYTYPSDMITTATTGPQAPIAPTALNAVPADSTINLSWTDNSADETGFKVYVSTTAAKPGVAALTLAANAVSCQLTNLTQDTDYFIWVEAYNVIGSSSDINTSTHTLLAGVGSVTFNAATYSGVSGVTAVVLLTDSDLVAGTVNVELTSTSSPAITLTLTNTGTAHEYAGLVTFSTQVTAVAHRIQVANGDTLTLSYADASPAAAITDTAVWSSMAAPVTSALDVSGNGPDSFSISWTQNAGTAGYYLWIKENNNTAPVLGTDAPTTNLGSGAIVSTVYAAVATNATVYAWIAAYNSDGGFGTIQADFALPQLYPSNFNITEFWYEANNYLHVAWQNKGDAPLGYRVYVTNVDVKPATHQFTAGAGATYIVEAGAAANRYVWVDAVNANGPTTEHLSAPATAAAAAGIIVTPASNSLDISWTAPALAPDRYRVYVQDTATLNTAPKANPTGTSVTISGLDTGTTCYVWVVATYGNDNQVCYTYAANMVSNTTLGDSLALLSVGKTTTESSPSAWGAATAFDGNNGNLWGWNDGQMPDTNLDGTIDSPVFPLWVKVDLGAATNLKLIKLIWEGANAYAYKIQASPDDAAWTDIVTQTANPGGTLSYDVTGQSGRYIRLYVENSNTINFVNGAGWGMKIRELTVYGP